MKVEKVLNEQQQTQVEQSAQVTVPENETSAVSIFRIKDKNKVDENIQKKADSSLLEIANYIKKEDNKKITTCKTVGILGAVTSLLALFTKNLFFKGPKPSGLLAAGIAALAFATIAGIVEYFGGREKRKAGNTIMGIFARNPQQGEAPSLKKPEEDFIEKTGRIMLSAKDDESLSSEDIAKRADTVLGSKNVRTRDIYYVTSKNDNQKAENLLIVDAHINSAEYNGTSKHGIDKQEYEIPVEYTDFINSFLSTKNMSKKQAEKFIEIVKALQTDGIYSKNDIEGHHDGRKEDLEIFDMSGDGKLNYGDVSALSLYSKLHNNSISQAEKSALNNASNWDVNKLSETLNNKYSMDEILEMFDLNGDGNINEDDFSLYQNLDKNVEKFDLNADGKIDAKDVELRKYYAKAYITRYNNKGKFLDNLVEIMGGEECVKITKEYIEEEEQRALSK